MARITLFSTQAADGNSTVARVAKADKAVDEIIAIQVSGTWSGVTVKPQICLNYDSSTSPITQTWVDAQNVKDDGTLTSISMTASGSLLLSLPSDVYFRLNLSGSGSPVPSITAIAEGDIVSA